MTLANLAESVQMCLHALNHRNFRRAMANVDLRPMTLGEVLDRTFTLYREHFFLFAGITALPYLLMLIFRFGLLILQRGAITGTAPNLQSPGLLGGFVAGAFGSFFLLYLMIGLAQSATIAAVSDLYLGRPTTVGESYAKARGRILVVFAVMIMTFLATVVGLIFLIIPGIYLACRLAVSVPVAIVENQSPVASMERSMELTKDNAGQMFLLLLLVVVIGWVVGAVLQAPVAYFAFTSALTKHPISFGVSAYSYVAEYIAQVIVGPIGTISACLMYYNLRVKKEGFDIQHLMNSLGSVPRPLADPVGNQ
jgi:glycerophosphoryl diester phosphodiesterase family protein